MVEIGLIVLAFIPVVVILFRYRQQSLHDVTTPKQSQIIKRLWEYAETAIGKQRYELAEKALLKILKNDPKNTAAYNRLGLLYVRMDRAKDAVSCFDIASSLAPSVASLYNLGIVELQSGNLTQAASALERVIDLEPTSKRLLVFARVHQQLGNHKKVVDILQRVVDEEPSRRNLEYLAESYEAAKQYKKAEEVRQRLRGEAIISSPDGDDTGEVA
ncbi:MAG: tetratricopeptide repeat protein [Candidatus Saccharimonadales bacterium]